jgi:hypothetical protein
LIIAEITHGLGNQMFQYAAARALAVRLGAPLKLDTSWFKGSTYRLFLLDRFQIRATVATPFEESWMVRLKRPRAVKVMEFMRRCKVPGAVTRLVDEERGYDDRFRSLQGNVLLQGYWQSEQYFDSIAPLLRAELTMKAPPDAANAAMEREMDSCEAVVVHVRRGDYVSNPVFAERHGVCELDYYRRGMELLRQSVRDPHCFIFSDDPDWAEQNLRLEVPCTYVTHNAGKQDHEDLRLMRHGKHFIVANSSFSWWGAWLSDHPGKRVIAPRQWYRNGGSLGRDMVPRSWTTA